MLFAALVVAVGSVTAVVFFTDRVDRAMVSGASELLAADLLVSSAAPIDESLAEAAREAGLSTARTLSFRSMLSAGERFQLAEVKAVGEGYPLRGQVRVAPEPFGADRPATGIPARGEVWLDARLISVLDLRVGDHIDLGETRLRVESVISFEPDRGGDLFSIAPRLLMNLADVAATGLVQPGSRVRHRLLFAGAPDAVERFRRDARERLVGTEHFHGIRDARPELRAALDRANQFLGLAALVSVLLGGVAVAVASRRHAERHQDVAAVLRCLGASQAVVTRIYGVQVIGLGLGASLAGCALGFAGQWALAAVLGNLLVSELPPPGMGPVVSGLLVGLITLVGFGFPPLMRLRDVPPARVLRKDLGVMPPTAWAVYGSAVLALGALVWWQAGNTTLAVYVAGGTVGTLGVLSLAAMGLVHALGRLRGRVGVAWRFGLANISRRARGSLVQVIAFGLGIMVMLLLTFVRNDLLEDWQRNLPPDAPNFFLINVPPDEAEAVATLLASHGVSTPALHPMIRGRLTSIGERAISEDDYGDHRARRLATREFNLSWARLPQSDNRIVAGRWWDPDRPGAGEFSVEQGLANTLGIALGDELEFSVAGQRVRGRVTSLRTVEWDSFQVNFFVVSPPGMLDALPATFITSFHLPAGQRPVLSTLVREHPSVTVLDVDALMTKVRQIMEQASIGVQYVFLFTLLAGLTVLFAAIQSTLDDRRYETAVLRTLGADRPRLLLGLATEFVTLGLLAGLLAAVAATAVGAVLASEVFQLGYRPDPGLWVVGLLGGGLGVGLAGLIGTRAVLRQPPLQTLRGL